MKIVLVNILIDSDFVNAFIAPLQKHMPPEGIIVFHLYHVTLLIVAHVGPPTMIS